MEADNMTKQKKGLWTFLFSLIPGAGEMYMGFRKQGISIMLLFWGIIAIASGTSLSWIIMFLPILWFYSFFNVHNLKSLSEEEFYSIEDNYVLHLDQLIGDADIFVNKYRTIVAVLLIFFGVSILWSNFTDLLFWILPSRLAEFISALSYRLPEIVIAVAIIIAGFYILSHKKAQLDEDYKDSNSEEHYWEPYRPYQQPEDAGMTHTNTPDTAARSTATEAYSESTATKTFTESTKFSIPQAESTVKLQDSLHENSGSTTSEHSSN